jgi:hypothetical protein
VKYVNRLTDNELSEKLNSSGAVLIRGAKACGKIDLLAEVDMSRIYAQANDAKVFHYRNRHQFYAQRRHQLDFTRLIWGIT